jgi:hypothetical protein
MLERNSIKAIVVIAGINLTGCTEPELRPDDGLSSAPQGYIHSVPSPAALSRSALEAEARSADPGAITAQVADAENRVAARLASEPNADAAATVVFTAGIRPGALAKLAATAKVEIASIELKVPNTDPDRVFTISIGAKDLLSRPGTVGERLERAIGRVRAEFYQMSQAEGDATEKARLEAVAFSPSVIVYKAELVGKVSSLAALRTDRSLVSAMFMEHGNDRASSYRLLKSHLDLPVAGAPPSAVPMRTVLKRVVLPRGEGPPPP